MEKISSETIRKSQKKDSVKTNKPVNGVALLPDWESISTAVRSKTKDKLPFGYSVYHSYNSSLW